jgi:hypothetical protein
MVGGSACAHRIGVLAAAVAAGWTAAQLSELDLAYAPPFGPIRDPLGVAARAAQRGAAG